MYCQIVPNDVLLKVVTEYETDEAKRIKLLETIQENIRLRYNRSVIYNNRPTFMPALAAQLQRESAMERLWFYDCNHQFSFPRYPQRKKEERHEDDKPTAEQPRTIVPQTHITNMDDTHDFFRDVYGRKSFDNRSATVRFYSNYGQEFDNAFWDGRQMVFGTGGQFFNDFGATVDIVSHEFTHAVVQYTCELIYHGQPGALNEHLADVFGTLVKQHQKKQTVDKADWLVGQGLWDSNKLPKSFISLRSMKNPGDAFPGDMQPDHMLNLYRGPDDNEGVHINSGIPNKVFYLAATWIGGYAWETIGKVWFETMQDRAMVPPRADFLMFAKATYAKAQKLFPQKLTIARSIRDAWSQVGVNW